MAGGLGVEGLHFHFSGEGDAGEVAGDGCGGGIYSGSVRDGEEESGWVDGGRGAAVEDMHEAEDDGEARGESSATIRLDLRTRRVRIKPEAKREEYIGRLEALMRDLDGIINDPTGVKDVQIRAVHALISAVRMCYKIVREMDVENLEEQLQKLTKENKHQKRLLYEIEE